MKKLSMPSETLLIQLWKQNLWRWQCRLHTDWLKETIPFYFRQPAPVLIFLKTMKTAADSLRMRFVIYKYEIRNTKYEIRNLKWEIRNTKFEMGNLKWEI